MKKKKIRLLSEALLKKGYSEKEIEETLNFAFLTSIGITVKQMSGTESTKKLTELKKELEKVEKSPEKSATLLDKYSKEITNDKGETIAQLALKHLDEFIDKLAKKLSIDLKSSERKNIFHQTK